MQELVQQLPRGQFDRLVRKHRSDRYAKQFKSWDQFTAMAYGQLSGASSLRDLEVGFNAQRSHHYHLGTKELRRSTLADANARRTPQLYADVAQSLMAQVGRTLRRDSAQLLYALDSTSITLKGERFDAWTTATRTRHTQGVKVHVLYEAGGQVPQWTSITAPNVNDRDEAVRMPLQAGALYVFDKGYCDYNWWHAIDQAGARFVTRFKRNAALTQVHERTLACQAQDAGVLRDRTVRFTHKAQGGGRRNRYDRVLREVHIAREGHPPLVLATNDLDSPPEQIAQHYKDRWQIELFFKWIKQHLNIKRFLGDSQNAVKIQILIALITYLLLALYKQRHRLTESLWTLLSELRATLFQRPALEARVHHRRTRLRDHLAAVQPALFQ